MNIQRDRQVHLRRSSGHKRDKNELREEVEKLL